MLRGPEVGASESLYMRSTMLIASGALVLSACGGGYQDNIEGAPKPAATSVSKAPEPVEMVFDHLGSADLTVPVFPGIKKGNKALKEPTYKNKDTVTAKCKLTGREVESDPENGETYRKSDQWILIDKGKKPEIAPQYASAVYTYNYKDLLAKLKECTPESLAPSK